MSSGADGLEQCSEARQDRRAGSPITVETMIVGDDEALAAQEVAHARETWTGGGESVTWAADQESATN
jgi:hypothetical protein